MSLLLIIIPLIASALLLIARPAGVRNLALAVGIANLAVSIFAAMSAATDGTVSHVFSAPWVAGAGIHFSLGMDGISLLMVLLTNLLAPLIILSSYSRSFDNESRYYGLVLLMLGALNLSLIHI